MSSLAVILASLGVIHTMSFGSTPLFSRRYATRPSWSCPPLSQCNDWSFFLFLHHSRLGLLHLLRPDHSWGNTLLRQDRSGIGVGRATADTAGGTVRRRPSAPVWNVRSRAFTDDDDDDPCSPHRCRRPPASPNEAPGLPSQRGLVRAAAPVNAPSFALLRGRSVAAVPPAIR